MSFIDTAYTQPWPGNDGSGGGVACDWPDFYPALGGELGPEPTGDGPAESRLLVELALTPNDDPRYPGFEAYSALCFAGGRAERLPGFDPSGHLHALTPRDPAHPLELRVRSPGVAVAEQLEGWLLRYQSWFSLTAPGGPLGEMCAFSSHVVGPVIKVSPAPQGGLSLTPVSLDGVTAAQVFISTFATDDALAELSLARLAQRSPPQLLHPTLGEPIALSLPPGHTQLLFELRRPASLGGAAAQVSACARFELQAPTRSKDRLKRRRFTPLAAVLCRQADKSPANLTEHWVPEEDGPDEPTDLPGGPRLKLRPRRG